MLMLRSEMPRTNVHKKAFNVYPGPGPSRTEMPIAHQQSFITSLGIASLYLRPFLPNMYWPENGEEEQT